MDAIQEQIRQRISEIGDERKRLDLALAALKGESLIPAAKQDSAVKPKRTRRRRTSSNGATRRGTTSRSDGATTREAIVALLTATPGQLSQAECATMLHEQGVVGTKNSGAAAMSKLKRAGVVASDERGKLTLVG